MPSFDEVFSTTSEEPIKYKDKFIVRSDYFPFVDGDRFVVRFEKTHSEWIQGIGLYAFALFEINKKQYPERIVFWENNSPKQVAFTIFIEKKKYHPKGLPKEGLLGIKNIWDTGDGTIESWFGGAAMIVEEIENGRRYWCNDGHPDENFDDIIFTVQRVTH